MLKKSFISPVATGECSVMQNRHMGWYLQLISDQGSLVIATVITVSNYRLKLRV
jgi:hypothetical protein